MGGCKDSGSSLTMEFIKAYYLAADLRCIIEPDAVSESAGTVAQ